MDQSELQEIIERGDADACMGFFEGKTDKERSSVAKFCCERYRSLHRESERKEKTEKRLSEQVGAARVAAIAACSFSDIKRLGWHARPTDDQIVRVFADRRPKWIGQWVEWLLEEEWYWYRWTLVRRLVREGIFPKPSHPHYALAMITGINCRTPGGRVINRLREDPELLDDEVWRLFEYEGAGENSLVNYDSWKPGRPWITALCTLDKSGELQRDRLLDCSLDALGRDFNPYRAKWFSAFHDALEPTDVERLARADRYLDLLISNVPTTVAWAFKIVETLDKQQPYPADKLAEGVSPVLRSRQKGIVKKTLKLLDRIAKREPSSARAISLAASEGLAHEAVDVQEAALKTIEKHGSPGDEELCGAIAALADMTAPSLRSKLASWTIAEKSDSDASTTDDTSGVCTDLNEIEERAARLDPRLRQIAGVDQLIDALKSNSGKVPAATFDGTEFARLDPASHLEPIRNLDELFDVCARVLEEPSLVDEAELAFDGFSRLCDQRPDDFDVRIGPVLKRAMQKLERFDVPFAGLGPANDIGGILIAWGRGGMFGWTVSESGSRYLTVELDGEEHSQCTEQLDRVLGYLSRRSLALAERVLSGVALPLLSAPTHRGGWIDAVEFVRRMNAWVDADIQPDRHDICMALLRLAPERRAEALADQTESSEEWVQAACYGLGATGISIGPTAGLWACAARARSPWSDDEAVHRAFPRLGPDAGRAASYSFKSTIHRGSYGPWTSLGIESKPKVPKRHNRDVLPVQLHIRHSPDDVLFDGPLGGESTGTVRWAATVWPCAMEAYFAAGMTESSQVLKEGGAYWQHRSYMEPLLDPDVPMLPTAVTLLTVGLAAKDPGEYGLATDAMIASIEDGRLDGERLGNVMADLLPTGHIIATRWAKTPAEVARISPLHAAVARQAIELSLRGDPADSPRDVHALLTLLRELCIDAGEAVTDSKCREFLGQFAGSTKAAKAAKALLKLERDDRTADARYRTAACSSLEKRLERVVAWERRVV